MNRFLAVLFASLAMNAYAQFGHASPEIQVESASQGGLSSLSVRSDTRGAAAWLDNVYRGSVPLDLTGLAPGYHVLRLERSGYYDEVIQLSLAADTKTTVTASLRLMTGFLQVTAEPYDAEVWVDGKRFSPGSTELPVGQKTVVVKAFGYREQEFSVYIPERMYAFITARLETAPFEAYDFSASRSVFNPRNSGTRGFVAVSFEVSAAGSGEATVSDATGAIVAEYGLGPFDDWDQGLSWDGRDEAGRLLPDGDYSIRLSVRPAPGVAYVEAEYVWEETVSLDSSLVIVPKGRYGSLPGSYYAPEALPPPDDALDLSMAATVDMADPSAPGFGVAMAMGLSMSGLFDMGLGAEVGSEPSDAAIVAGLRVSAPLQGPASLAAVLDGRLAEATAGAPAFVRLGAALGLGTRFLNAVIAPDLSARWENGYSSRTGLGAALSVSGYSFGAALSARLESGPLESGFALELPVRSALELRFLPAGLPLTFCAFAGLDWSPAPGDWFAGLRISGGL